MAPGTSGRSGRRRGPWIVAASLVVAVLATTLVVVITSAVRSPTATPSATSPPSAGNPTTAATPAGLRCAERQPDFSAAPTDQGRVRSGRLSYPQLGAPFAAPTRTTLLRFDYLNDVASQFAELRYEGMQTGGAEVMIARLPFADGFSTPRQISRVLYDCVRQRFPGAEEDVRRNAAARVAGRAGWVVRAHLGYGEVDAGVKNEEIILAVAPTADGENGLFYADVPDTHPELLPGVESALRSLTVG